MDIGGHILKEKKKNFKKVDIFQEARQQGKKKRLIINKNEGIIIIVLVYGITVKSGHA